MTASPRCRRAGLLGIAVFVCLPTLAEPASPAAEDLDSLRQRIEQLEAADRAKDQRIARLQSQLGDQWLTERRAAEIRGLVADVLADAQTRSTLLAEGAMAGIDDNGKIFLQSADGSFYANVSGQIQMRYLFDYQDSSDPITGRADETESGFQARRVKVQIAGHIADPKLTYTVRVANSRATANTSLEEAKIGYAFDNGLFVTVGKMKLPLLREELTSSKRQLTVERSSVNEYFTANFAEQVQLGWKGKDVRLVAAVSDGANSESSEFNADIVEFALTGRVDVRVDGDWKQAADFTSWRDEAQAVFLGAAGHYEVIDGANNAGSFDGTYTVGTVDASYENRGFSLYGAYVISYFDDQADAPAPLGGDLFSQGVVVQSGYHVTAELEPFVRYEWLDADDDDEAAIATQRDPAQIITAGANYYFRKHNAKFTADVVYVFAGDEPVANPLGANAFSSSLGFSDFDTAEADPNLLLRLQFQLLF